MKPASAAPGAPASPLRHVAASDTSPRRNREQRQLGKRFPLWPGGGAALSAVAVAVEGNAGEAEPPLARFVAFFCPGLEVAAGVKPEAAVQAGIGAGPFLGAPG